MAGPSIKLPMIGYGQSFLRAGGIDSTQFDMAAALGLDEKTEPLKNSDHLGGGEPP